MIFLPDITKPTNGFCFDLKITKINVLISLKGVVRKYEAVLDTTNKIEGRKNNIELRALDLCGKIER